MGYPYCTLALASCRRLSVFTSHVQFPGMQYLHQRDIIHRDLKSSNGMKRSFANLNFSKFHEVCESEIISMKFLTDGLAWEVFMVYFSTSRLCMQSASSCQSYDVQALPYALHLVLILLQYRSSWHKGRRNVIEVATPMGDTANLQINILKVVQEI